MCAQEFRLQLPGDSLRSRKAVPLVRSNHARRYRVSQLKLQESRLSPADTRSWKSRGDEGWTFSWNPRNSIRIDARRLVPYIRYASQATIHGRIPSLVVFSTSNALTLKRVAQRDTRASKRVAASKLTAVPEGPFDRGARCRCNLRFDAKTAIGERDSREKSGVQEPRTSSRMHGDHCVARETHAHAEDRQAQLGRKRHRRRLLFSFARASHANEDSDQEKGQLRAPSVCQYERRPLIYRRKSITGCVFIAVYLRREVRCSPIIRIGGSV